jgi:4-hydroxysphinganine ceramide fatty acyl 2-hydroxylase
MASNQAPTFLRAEIESRNTKNSCFVTIGPKVYDITDFLEDHPGGPELILDYGGKDVTEILKDEASHTHSESAYEILDESFVGYVATDAVTDTATQSHRPDEVVPLPPTANGKAELKANGAMNGAKVPTRPLYESTGMSTAEDLSVETDLSADYKQHKFLDLNKPLLMQVWRGGFSKKFYLEQVHRPRHYRGGKSAPLFGNFLEPLSLTPWYVVPICWLPPVFYGTYLALQALPLWQVGAYWIGGLCIWTIVEYGLHRCLFHLDE